MVMYSAGRQGVTDDVIGFPALAATSMDQGRLAAYHAFNEPARCGVAVALWRGKVIR